ncbi:hypothetical protein [Mangrovibacterium marinum]|uniref:HTH cro/C1-type domain-containing protein n=1 Tax=Mangrovibacterium marinum TaxID=1639118 RepID=A0A2T5BXC0_9BACT|nr:hypothetical protein [Mangrovibacterium marinum]PTN04789.1 hypothetical protein C8N47_1297 [Mangrovibacterium marinum]
MGISKKKTAEIKTELVNLIQLELTAQNMDIRTFASHLQLSVSATRNMLNGNQMTLDRLHEISVILNFNFFRFWADQLQIDQPASADIERIKALEIENRTLIKLLKG